MNPQYFKSEKIGNKSPQNILGSFIEGWVGLTDVKKSYILIVERISMMQISVFFFLYLYCLVQVHGNMPDHTFILRCYLQLADKHLQYFYNN